MARAPTPAQALQRLIRQRPGIAETMTALEDTARYSDRETALIATTLVEQSLEAAIDGKFVELPDEHKRAIFEGDYEREAVIGSLYAKTHLAYALGIFGPVTRGEVNSIRWIRNAFAHAPIALSFSTMEIKSTVKFTLLDRMRLGKFRVARPTDERSDFVLTCGYYSMLFSAGGPGNVPRPRRRQPLSTMTKTMKEYGFDVDLLP